MGHRVANFVISYLGPLYTRPRANVQPKSSIPIGAKVEISPKLGFTLGVKAEIEKKKLFHRPPPPPAPQVLINAELYGLVLAPRLKKDYHQIWEANLQNPWGQCSSIY
jgi:hypothetical protein